MSLVQDFGSSPSTLSNWRTSLCLIGNGPSQKLGGDAQSDRTMSGTGNTPHPTPLGAPHPNSAPHPEAEERRDTEAAFVDVFQEENTVSFYLLKIILPLILFFFCLFAFSRTALWHMEVPRLGV